MVIFPFLGRWQGWVEAGHHLFRREQPGGLRQGWVFDLRELATLQQAAVRCFPTGRVRAFLLPARIGGFAAHLGKQAHGGLVRA